MQLKGVTAERAWRTALPAIAALALAVVMTWPLAAGLGSLGRTGVGRNADPHFGTNGDGMFSLWNVAWVARTIVADPLNLFDANIFHPHRNSLAYSEANIMAGVVGAPVWWATENPYATLNVVILLAFASAWFCMWKLVRHLTDDWAVAAAAASCYAFCPYVFSHTAHIQLMITGGIPLAMLLMHRLADAPTPRRGLALGITLMVQALACAYYGIFAALMVGFSVVFFTISRSLLRNRAWWSAIAVAAMVSIAGVAPFLLPYYGLRTDEGFARTLDDSIRYSANLSSYLISSAFAHRWLARDDCRLAQVDRSDVPGALHDSFWLRPVWFWQHRAVQAPRPLNAKQCFCTARSGCSRCGLHSVRPRGCTRCCIRRSRCSRFFARLRGWGLWSCMCLAVIAAFGLRRLVMRVGGTRGRQVAVALGVVALAELVTRMPWERAVVLPDAYVVARGLPKAPLAEFPFYGGRSAWHLHTQYMLFSTSHWLPMMNGYSDHTPLQFRQDALSLDGFPSPDSFAILAKARVRYIGVHWDMFGPRAGEIRTRLQPYNRHLRPLVADGRMSLFEIISFP